MDSIIPWITVVLNVILTAVISKMISKFFAYAKETKAREQEKKERQIAQDAAINSALLAVLRDRLYDACFKSLDKGKITPDDRENIESLHDSYKVLGGNHTGDLLTARALELKIVNNYEEVKDNG